MKNKDGHKTDSSTLDAPLKLLPMLALNYPGSLHAGQLSGDTPQVQVKCRKHCRKIKRLAEMDQAPGRAASSSSASSLNSAKFSKVTKNLGMIPLGSILSSEDGLDTQGD